MTLRHFCTLAAAASRSEPFALPSLQRMTHRLRRLVPPDKSVFHSGPGPSGYKLQGIYYAREYGLKTIWDYGDPTMIEMATDAGQLRKYWKLMSAAYSLASRGRVWVVLPDDPALGASWFKGTIWDTIEWPILEQNPAVTNVFRVNPLTLPADGVDIKPLWSIPPRRSE